MKNVVKCFVSVSLICLSLSCASTGSKTVDSRPRFHESASANVVLRFNSWDYIHMLQPDYRDNGFFHPIRRNELGSALGRFGVRRDLAVVVIGWNYDTQLAEIMTEWRAVLAANGFHRAVIVRGNGSDSLEGTVILDDAQLSTATTASGGGQ